MRARDMDMKVDRVMAGVYRARWDKIKRELKSDKMIEPSY